MHFGKTPADWELQRLLLAAMPRTSDLRDVPMPPAARTLRLRCERSMPFEFVAELMAPFMALWDARLAFTASDYDPSLAGAIRPAGEEDVLVLWIDWRLHVSLAPGAVVRWVGDLVGAQRKRSSRGLPVLVNDWPLGPGSGLPESWGAAVGAGLESMAQATPDCHVIQLERLRREECPNFFDARNDAVAHYPFSQAATVHVARYLGAQVLPALATPRLKVIAVDLDNTLYSGVLGEDGPSGLRLGPGHLALQRELLRLRDQGFVLALCSRNERADVVALFAQRKDFAVSLADFAAARIDWGAKSENLRSIAAQLNLHPSAVLFVDDNPAELSRVAEAVPEVSLLLADPEGTSTAAMLARHPGLHRLRADAASAVRPKDLQANEVREQLRASSGSTEEYLARLGMVVDVFENWEEHASRIHELSNKTNQFNLCLARFSEQDVARVLGAGHLTLTVGLRDALANSGIVAVLAFDAGGKDARLVEFLMSCRALGRDIEAVALIRALERLSEMGCDRVRIEPKVGPRNQPALEFLHRFVPEGRNVTDLSELKRVVGEAVRNHPAEVKVHR